MEIIGYLGLIGSVALLIWMALRGVDIMFAAILSALFVIITNAMPLADSLLTGLQRAHWAPLLLLENSFLSQREPSLGVPWVIAVLLLVSRWPWYAS